jgi:hypothetical protein
MWTVYADGSRLFTRTLDRDGPMHTITHNDRHAFMLPFDATGREHRPVRLEADLVMPGRTTVLLGPIGRVQGADAVKACATQTGVARREPAVAAAPAEGYARHALDTRIGLLLLGVPAALIGRLLRMTFVILLVVGKMRPALILLRGMAMAMSVVGLLGLLLIGIRSGLIAAAGHGRNRCRRAHVGVASHIRKACSGRRGRWGRRRVATDDALRRMQAMDV